MQGTSIGIRPRDLNDLIGKLKYGLPVAAFDRLRERLDVPDFTERGFGIRGALGLSDRGHAAVSQLKKGPSTGNISSVTSACVGFTPAEF